MRKLTIKREKSSAGCLMKMKVYIEDAMSDEIKINGVSCRKLGDLKNGEEKEFSIGNEETKVYVIADSLSKDICNEYTVIPEGEIDVYRKGKNHLNPAAGNPFIFDGEVSEDIVQNRKKSKKKSIIVTICAVIVGLAIGFGSTMLNDFDILAADKTFKYEEMSITLTNKFEKTNYEGFDVCFDSTEIAVFVIKEDGKMFGEFESKTAADYLEMIKKAHSLDSNIQIKTQDGITYMEYEATTEDGEEAKYYMVSYKTDEAFWSVQFAGVKDKYEKHYDKFINWAKSVKFE